MKYKIFGIIGLWLVLLAMANTCCAEPGIVWYIPGFENKEKDFNVVRDKVQEIYPEAASVEVKFWDAPRNDNYTQIGVDWANSIPKAEQGAENLALQMQQLTAAEQSRLIIVGYSLGARVAVRSIAQFRNESGNKATIRQLVLLGAAVNNDDRDIETAFETCTEPIINIVNVQDAALSAYSLAERGGALGNGYLLSVSPKELIEISSKQGTSHDINMYLDRLKKAIIEKDVTSDEIIVPQDNMNVRMSVANGGVWWENLDQSHDWTLQKNQTTGYCRIVSPNNKRMAWGRQLQMTKSFNKVKKQLGPEEAKPLPNDWWTLVSVQQDYTNAKTFVTDGRVWWDVLDEDNGWTLQQHKVSGHCRIIDPASVRRAWGGEEKMNAAFADVKIQNKKLLDK